MYILYCNDVRIGMKTYRIGHMIGQTHTCIFHLNAPTIGDHDHSLRQSSIAFSHLLNVVKGEYVVS